MSAIKFLFFVAVAVAAVSAEERTKKDVYYGAAPYAYSAGYVAPAYHAGYVAPTTYSAGYVAPTAYSAGYVAPAAYSAGYVAPAAYPYGAGLYRSAYYY